MIKNSDSFRQKFSVLMQAMISNWCKLFIFFGCKLPSGFGAPKYPHNFYISHSNS